MTPMLTTTVCYLAMSLATATTPAAYTQVCTSVSAPAPPAECKGKVVRVYHGTRLTSTCLPSREPTK